MHQPARFQRSGSSAWSEAANTDIGDLAGFLEALRQRHDYFHAQAAGSPTTA